MLPDGEFGELVFTSLSKEAMPVIRYRTRDLTRLLPPTARSMRRMDKITGRSDDMLIIRGVNVFPTQIEELVLKTAQLAPHYQILLTRSGNLDEIEVLSEVRPECAHFKVSEREQIAKELRHAIKSFVGVSASVRVLEAGQVERSVTGKARRVIDQRSR